MPFRSPPLSSTLARVALTVALAAAAASTASDAQAVGTRTFVLDSLEKLSGGDLKGVAVGSDGAVRAGFTLGNAPIPDAGASFSTLKLSDGSMLIGTGPNGRIYRVVGDAVSMWADTGALGVTAMVQARGGVVYAATMPDGKIFKVSQGKATPFVTLPDTSYVWALVLDRAGTGLFAGTGPDGRVMRIEPNGTSSVYYRSTEAHLVSLAMGDSGELYAGSSPKGYVYKITGPGRATVLFELPGSEAKAVAVAKGGVVYAICNDYVKPPTPPRRSSSAGRVPASASSAPHPKPGKGSLFRIDASGRPEKLMKHDDTHYTSLTLDETGRPYVGTGEGGKVYTVDDAHAVSLVADVSERQIGALFVERDRGIIATTDPPVVHRIVGRGGADAVWTSKPLDAGLRASFGTLTWRATGALELSARTGNTQEPDASWSAWGAPLTTQGPLKVARGRFVQVRARWSRDPKAVLTEVTIPFLTDNVRPVVLEVSAAPKGASTPEPTGKGIPASGGEPPKHDPVMKITWKVDNADNDPLRYRVSFRREGQAVWRDAIKSDEVHTKTELEWDTSALPEGAYRIRVEASDEIANPADQVLRHALESELVLIDNTPPRIEGLELNGRRLRGRVVDGTSPIARIEVSIDGQLSWRPLVAADGILDTKDERFDADVKAIVPPGNHIVAVRAFDAAGNAVIRDVESR